MIKHLPRAAGDLLEQYIGSGAGFAGGKEGPPAQRHAKRETGTAVALLRPVISLDQPKLELLNHANLFCREGLDIGTRAFLPHLPARRVSPTSAAATACSASSTRPAGGADPGGRELHGGAVGARENWQAILGERPADIRAGDGLAEQPPGSLDLVLCNPPFHQQQVVGDFLAWRMFTQAKAARPRAASCGSSAIATGYHLAQASVRQCRAGRRHAEIRRSAVDQGMNEVPVRLSIQQFAARTGLFADTLRYYEKIGLLRQVARDASGFRVYGPRDLEWIGFILRLKDTGMALDDIIRYAGTARMRRYHAGGAPGAARRTCGPAAGTHPARP